MTLAYLFFRSFLADDGTDRERVELKNLIYEIKWETPFDAMGLFIVDLSTITSVASSIMTYLVIMVQFHQATPVTEDPEDFATTWPANLTVNN